MIFTLLFSCTQAFAGAEVAAGELKINLASDSDRVTDISLHCGDYQEKKPVQADSVDKSVIFKNVPSGSCSLQFYPSGAEVKDIKKDIKKNIKKNIKEVKVEEELSCRVEKKLGDEVGASCMSLSEAIRTLESTTVFQMLGAGGVGSPSTFDSDEKAKVSKAFGEEQEEEQEEKETYEESHRFLFQSLATTGSSNSGNFVLSAYPDEKNSDIEALDALLDESPATDKEEMKVQEEAVFKSSTLKIQEITFAGGECKQDISSAVEKYSGKIESCHASSLKSNPNVNGQLVVDVEIFDGKVMMSRLSSNQTGDSGLGACVEKRIKKWRFPSNCSDVISIPFLFIIK